MEELSGDQLEILAKLGKLRQRTLFDRLAEVAGRDQLTPEELAHQLAEIEYRDKMTESALIEHSYYLANLDLFDPLYFFDAKDWWK